MSPEEKDGKQREKKDIEIKTTGIEPWDTARRTEMRELAKGTKGDPFELAKKRKDDPK